MSSTGDFAKMVPGFEFLQGLMKNAGSAIPGMNQWIAPTLDPAELDKRIDELRTVQFWLEQNARMLATTIQALEVQRMTLATLKTMNLPMTDLRDALKARAPAPAPAPASEEPAPAAAKRRKTAPAAAPAAAAVDPMQWWGALTQQFTEIAGKAMKDGAAEAARTLAGAAVKQGVATAGSTLKAAAAVPAQVARAAGRRAAPRKRAG